MSKYLVDGELLNYLVDFGTLSPKSNICPPLGDCPKVNSCLECLAEHSGKVLPLAPAQERAGDEEEWVVVKRWKLESAYPCTQSNNIYSTHRTAEEWIAYLATPSEKGGGKDNG